MFKLGFAIASPLFLVAVLVVPATGQVRRESSFSRLNQLPSSFEPNLGQAPSEVKYLVRSGGQTIFLNSDGAVLHLASLEPNAQRGARNIKLLRSAGVRTATVGMSFRNSQAASSIESLDPLPGKINYLHGNDPSKWLSNVPIYGQVAYRNVYPGIDLIYHGQQGTLEYDFVAKSGADPSAIQVQFQGADQIGLSPEGDLILNTTAGQIRWKRPRVYQEDHGRRKTIAARYRIEKDSHVTFLLAKYDRNRPLIIDPQLVYGTLLGGSAYDSGFAEVDSTGIYVAGTTYSFNFPTTSGEDQQLQGEYDIFLTKLNPQGNALIYSTYIGGSDHDSMNAVWLAPDGSFYLTGFTSSYDFPTYPANVISTTYNGGNEEAFVSHISSDGTRFLFSTYLGGSVDDDAYSMWVDTSGNVYLAGETGSYYDFPVTNGAYQTTFGGGTNDAFVTKINPTATALIYSTYLGGFGDEEIQNAVISPNAPPNLIFVYGVQLSVDLSGNAYISGLTTSTNFPTTAGAYSRVNHGGGGDGFITKLNSTGTQLVYSTYFGGSGFDAIQSKEVFPDGSLLVAGVTSSTDFPTTTGAYRRTPNANHSQVGFAARFDPTGSQLLYSTFFGGTGGEGFVVAYEGGNGSVLLSGLTFSSDLPTTQGAFQPTYAGGGDIFLSFFDVGITNLIDSSYLGTPGYDSGSGYFGPGGPTDVVVSGGAGGASFPTTSGAYSRTYAGGTSDAFVARFTYSGGCQEILSGASLQVGAAGGTQTIGITAPAGCVWFAFSNQSWLTYTTNTYGSGNGSVSFSVQANTGAARTAIMTIAGTEVTVQQAAAGACTYTLDSASASFSLSGGSGSIGVTAGSGCSWSVTDSLSWVHILSGASGTGNGTVTYSADASATPRSGTITVAGVNYGIFENAAATALAFYPVTPCRVADTRGNGKSGAFGPPSMSGGHNSRLSDSSQRLRHPRQRAGLLAECHRGAAGTIDLPDHVADRAGAAGGLHAERLFDAEWRLPGNVVANAAIVPAGTNGSVSVFVSDTSDVIIDVNGYFAPPATGGLGLLPAGAVPRGRYARQRQDRLVRPARHGRRLQPQLPDSAERLQRALHGAGLLAEYDGGSPGQLTYLTTWPSGQSMPTASTLNDFSNGIPALDVGQVVANAAIVPAGTTAR